MEAVEPVEPVERVEAVAADRPLPVSPAHWEADVVLRDGRTCHVRPIGPHDADRLRAFHAALSPDTVYLRYFAPHPELSEADVERLTGVDHVDRVALVATVRDEIIGVGRYDRLAADEAEVAFTVRDDHQGRGLGSVLLEHLAAAARDQGVRRFVADVLPQNRRMRDTFEMAGYTPTSRMEDGYLELGFDIEPTARSRSVLAARERAAEARSIRRLLSPSTVAVIGASRMPGAVGHEVLRHLRDAGFTGQVYAVHPEADAILGFPCLRHVADAPTAVDLAVLAVPATAALHVVDECAAAGVRGLVVLSQGFAESGGEAGRARQERLVASARASGMRVVGPAALGMVNTDPHVRLNASLVPALPPRGRLGLFCQSGALGSVILEQMGERGLGISTFLSAGNRVDVSGNDLLQHWTEDAATDAALLYLESVGNPRKFTRIARRLSRAKPVVAVRSGGAARTVPAGHLVRATSLPPRAVDALIAQAGVIQVRTVRAMLDVAQLLATQPLPPTDAVAVVATSEALARLASDAIGAAGLGLSDAGSVLPVRPGAGDLGAAVRRAAEAPGVGAVLVVHVPPLPADAPVVREALAPVLPALSRPVAVVSLATVGEPAADGRRAVPWIGPVADGGLAAPGAVPLFATVEEAVQALAGVMGRRRWLGRTDATPPEPDDRVATEAERRALELAGDAGRVVTAVEAADLLGLFGIGRAAPDGASHPGADTGLACRVTVVCDEVFGPVISFGLDGAVAEFLGDRGWASPPLSRADAQDLMRAPGSAPLLLDSAEPSAVESLIRLLVGLGQLVDCAPAVRSADLLVVLREGEAWVAQGDIELLPPHPGPGGDRDRRML